MKVTTTIQSMRNKNGNLIKIKKLTITTIPVSWSCKKVGDVKNCFEMTGNGMFISKELPVGGKFRCLYGADAGNYLNKFVEFKITEKWHAADVIICTSSVVKGDTYRTDCNETLSYGYPFPHTAMTMTTALSLQNQLQKPTES